MPTIDHITLADLFAVVYRWRKLMVIAFFAVLIPSALVVLLMPPLYQADARLLISRDDDNSSFSTNVLAQTKPTMVHRTLGREEEVLSRVEMLKSRIIVEAVIDDMGIGIAEMDRIHDVRRYVRFAYKWVKEGIQYLYDETKYALRLSKRPSQEEILLLNNERRIENALDRLKVDVIKDTTVISVGFRSSDPLLAQQVANRICDEYVSFHSRTRESRSRSFFTDQADKLRSTLAAAESELERVKVARSGFSIGEARSLIIASRIQASDRLKAVVNQREQTNAQIKVLRAQLAAEPKRIETRRVIERNPVADQMDRKVTELVLERSRVSDHFFDDTETAQIAAERIEDAKRIRGATANTVTGQVISELNVAHETIRMRLLEVEVQLRALDAEANALRTQLADYESELSALSETTLRLNELEREVEQHRTAYDLYVRNREQARITEDMASASLTEVRIVDYASLPLNALRPRRLLYLSIALAGALLLALATPFFADYNNTRLFTARDVSKGLGLSFVASLPTL